MAVKKVIYYNTLDPNQAPYHKKELLFMYFQAISTNYADPILKNIKK